MVYDLYKLCTNDLKNDSICTIYTNTMCILKLHARTDCTDLILTVFVNI
jgi:hypothetical protein